MALPASRARVTILLGLILVAAIVGVVVWVVRYQPFGPRGPLGTPLPAGDPSSSGWRREADAPFARLEMASTVLDGRLWIAGGMNRDGTATAEVWIFDPGTGAWAEGPALPAPVDHAGLATDGERLYLVGGFRGPTREPSQDVLLLTADGERWTPGPMLPEPLAAGAAAWDGSRLLYGGGTSTNGDRAEIYAMEDDGWRRMGNLKRPRQHLAATSDGQGRTWFLGGRQGGLEHNLGDVDVVDGERVTQLGELTPRGGVAAFYDPRLGACLSGGEAPSFALQIVECIDDQGRITALPSMRQARHGLGIGVIGPRVYAVLGGDSPGLSVTRTVESLVIAR